MCSNYRFCFRKITCVCLVTLVTFVCPGPVVLELENGSGRSTGKFVVGGV